MLVRSKAAASGQGYPLPGVRNQQILGRERELGSVKQGDLLALGGTAHDNLATLKVVQVECMERLAVFQHDVVRDVDDVVD